MRVRGPCAPLREIFQSGQVPAPPGKTCGDWASFLGIPVKAGESPAALSAAGRALLPTVRAGDAVTLPCAEARLPALGQA